MRWRMKTLWVGYNGLMAALLAGLILWDYNVLIRLHDDNPHWMFTDIAMILCGFHILIALPIWLVILFLNRSRMTAKSFWIGFALVLVFLGMTSYPVISVLGRMSF